SRTTTSRTICVENHLYRELPVSSITSEERNPMATMLMQELSAGDVIEIKTAANVADDVMTVLVLLSTDEFLVLDPCNDSTPFVVKCSELIEYRKFDAEEVFAAV
ncbi:hypothetical protein, partial [Ilumatobacter sp.]|uniref:hypothetical protein n=2 Tax=Ilumatobacter sp. TaxID=1967498 RepID=UPI003751E16E